MAYLISYNKPLLDGRITLNLHVSFNLKRKDQIFIIEFLMKMKNYFSLMEEKKNKFYRRIILLKNMDNS